MKSTTKTLIWGGVIIGGAYLLYKYFTGGSNKPPESNYPSYDFMKGATDYVIEKGSQAPAEYWRRAQVFTFSPDINQNVIGAKQTQDFLNITGIITRVNPFTKPVAPIIDRIFEITSGSINKYLGGN